MKDEFDEDIEEEKPVEADNETVTTDENGQIQEDCDAKIAAIQQEADKKVLYALADKKNALDRAERDIAKARKYALDNIAEELLTVIDSLEQGLAVELDDSETAKSLHEGLELTLSILLKTLEKYGVKPIDPAGEPFDPNFHEAVSMQPNAEVDANTVLIVFQKGYLLHDRVIRPARVVVSSQA
ncbi:MAG: protein GrpE [marine bacterium B5-7]|nr:MAG: protein GrpE [marine bacterium B5-7]